MKLYKLSKEAIKAVQDNKLLRAHLCNLYGAKSDLTVTNWIKNNSPCLHTVQAIELICKFANLKNTEVYAD